METYSLPNAFVLLMLTLAIATVLSVIAEYKVSRRNRD